MAKWVLGHKIEEQETTGDYDLVIGTTPEHTPGPPPHHHTGLHEVFLVTEGEMQFVVDNQPRVVRKGESVNLPPSCVHTFANNSDAPCTWVNIHSPKGFLQFFKDLGVPDSEENAAEKSIDPQLIQKVIETAATYDMVISM